LRAVVSGLKTVTGSAPAELACGEAERLDLLPEDALTRIEPREARPVFRAREPGLHDCARAVRRALVLGDRPPVLDPEGAGGHELDEIEVPLALPRHHVTGERRGIEVVFREMPPQADRQPVDRLARGGSFDSLPVIHARILLIERGDRLDAERVAAFAREALEPVSASRRTRTSR
jgi:hypothetical protein